jgi:transcriptional regulator with XRE-family HTH domain
MCEGAHVSGTLEIGRALREARLARGLALEAIEERTKIRVRYLTALENERFGELPGDAYARGFLRTYADHVGLDGQEVLAAYRARERLQEETPVAPRPQRPYEPLRIGPAVAGLVTAVVLVASSLVAWQLGGEDEPRAPTRPAPSPAPASAAPAVLALTATGDAPLVVRRGGPQGRRVWSGTLREGRTLRLGLGRPLWLRTDAPQRLRLVVSGDPKRVPPGATAVVVTRDAVRAA